MPDIVKKYVLPALAAAAFVGLWQVAAMQYPSDQFPAPMDVIRAIGELVESGRLWTDIGISMFRFNLAYFMAVMVAVPLGLFFGRCKVCAGAIDPLVQVLRPISPIAWFPLAILWFGIGNVPAIFIIFIAAFFPMLLATISAVRAIPPVYFKVATNFGAKPAMVFLKIIIPAAFPGIMVGLHIALGTAWIHLVAGEMLGADSGLGYLIIDARNFLRTDLIMAGMLLVGVLGLIVNRGIILIEHLISRQWGVVIQND
ncbi:MAG: ABC transporter permease [Chlorobiales bacterium]|nr:ABC transporter permease [Chlorobiales bacterium]